MASKSGNSNFGSLNSKLKPLVCFGAARTWRRAMRARFFATCALFSPSSSWRLSEASSRSNRVISLVYRSCRLSSSLASRAFRSSGLGNNQRFSRCPSIGTLLTQEDFSHSSEFIRFGVRFVAPEPADPLGHATALPMSARDANFDVVVARAPDILRPNPLVFTASHVYRLFFLIKTAGLQLT